MNKKLFCPAGNTLLAGCVDGEEAEILVTPNCSVLEPINEENYDSLIKRCKVLWTNRVGIGFDLSTAKDPVSILKKLSMVNSGIKLGHRPQRGNMAVCKDTHPKIDEFILCKQSENDLYNFNISVGITDSSNVDEEMLNLMSKASWGKGDPGILFLDRLQGVSGANENDLQLIHSRIGKVNTVVPCGELPLYADGVCTLGSVNLGSKLFWSREDGFDEVLFEKVVRGGVRFLDRVVDIMAGSLSEVGLESMAENNLYSRRIGLGIMGWADALNHAGIQYGSEESYALAHRIGTIFKNASNGESNIMGRQYGRAPVLEGTTLTRRHLMIHAFPPTGGLTLLMGNKGYGIEPFFSDAADITPHEHLKMQSVWQHYNDSSISKTVNMSNKTTPNEIKSVWKAAMSINLKSVTIYRDGSHLDQPLTVGINKQDFPRGVCSL